MAFFCAGGSTARGKQKDKGSRPTKGTPITTNGKLITDPFHHPSALPSRRMVVIHEFKPQDNRGLAVLRGEFLQIIKQDGSFYLVRNEKGREGYVPSSHLLAPYSSTRTRLGSKSNPIRPVASGSSIHDLDAPSRSGSVGMYHSLSAGRPRRPPADPEEGRENRPGGIRRMVSPPTQSPLTIMHSDLSNNNNNISQQPPLTTAAYEQKYSPSSSSGVASLNGPSSPSFTSLQQSTSQENMANHASFSSLNHSQHGHSTASSLSSISEDDISHPSTTVPMSHHMSRKGPPSSEETISRYGKATSESNISSLKSRPLPHPPRRHEGVYVAQKTNHIYSTIKDEVPPPVPPRTYLAPGDGGNDQYSAYHGSRSQERLQHFNHPRVMSLNDIRGREAKQSAVYTAQYSPVSGPPRLRRHRGGEGMESDSATSEGGSVPTRSRSSSKKSGSRSRINEEEVLEEYPREKFPCLPECSIKDDMCMDRPTQLQISISKFRKCLWGLYVVTEDFEAQDENEVSVKHGEHVSVWNQDDREWYWIVKHTSNNSEGFVPSCHLREIVATDAKHVPALESVSEDGDGSAPPPDTPPRITRKRSGSQEVRSMNRTRRPSSGSSNGRRARVLSDSSSRHGSLRVRTPSVSSIEKTDIPDSPPSSPPPPYTEYDHARRFSLSQQQDPPANTYGVSMHRTRSQGTAHSQGSATYRPRSRSQHTQHLTLPTGDPLRSTGSREDQDVYQLRSPTAVNGGTLV